MAGDLRIAQHAAHILLAHAGHDLACDTRVTDGFFLLLLGLMILVPGLMGLVTVIGGLGHALVILLGQVWRLGRRHHLNRLGVISLRIRCAGLIAEHRRAVLLAAE